MQAFVDVCSGWLANFAAILVSQAGFPFMMSRTAASDCRLSVGFEQWVPMWTLIRRSTIAN